jgi:hypothetical protein
MLRLRLVNLPEVRRGHDVFLHDNERLIETTSQHGGDVALGHVQHHADFKRRSGKLQDTTDYKVVRLKGGRLLRVTNPQKYAPSIDGGARPHLIHAKNKPYLHFKGRRGWARVKFVNHPGNRAYRFLYNATDAAFRAMGQELRSGMTNLAKRF